MGHHIIGVASGAGITKHYDYVQFVKKYVGQTPNHYKTGHKHIG